MVPWLELTLWPMYSWLGDSVWDPFERGERERSQATFLTTEYVSNILISKSGRIGIWFTMAVQRISSFALQMVVKCWHPKSFLNDWDDHSCENLSIKTFFLCYYPASYMDIIVTWIGSLIDWGVGWCWFFWGWSILYIELRGSWMKEPVDIY